MESFQDLTCSAWHLSDVKVTLEHRLRYFHKNEFVNSLRMQRCACKVSSMSLFSYCVYLRCPWTSGLALVRTRACCHVSTHTYNTQRFVRSSGTQGVCSTFPSTFQQTVLVHGLTSKLLQWIKSRGYIKKIKELSFETNCLDMIKAFCDVSVIHPIHFPKQKVGH